jgi:carboxylesterase type B
MSTLYMSDRPSVEVDHEIAQRMSSYWARFAQTGDPNGPGLPQWPPVGATPQVMEVGHRNEPIPAAGSERKFQFFAAVLTREE